MLINLSNHSISTWSKNQLEAAYRLYEDVIDVAFPNVPPEGDYDVVTALAHEYLGHCLDILTQYPHQRNAVHIMGEMCFSFAMVSLLLKKNVECIASTTQRIVLEENGFKKSEFKFVRFRKYIVP